VTAQQQQQQQANLGCLSCLGSYMLSRCLSVLCIARLLPVWVYWC